MPLVATNTADNAWLSTVQAFSGPAVDFVEDSRGGPTRELLHVQLVIGDPRQRWAVSRVPPLNPAFAIVETIWVLAGRDDAKFLTPWNSQLTKFSGEGATFCGAYGKRLRSTFNFDQLTLAYEGLKANSASRQFVLQIWDPATDFPTNDGQPRNADIPCNVCSLLKIRRGRLEWLQVLRSNDVFLGLPYDIVQFTTIQEILAGWLGVEVGNYVHVSDSLHIYERDLEQVINARPGGCPENTDVLAVSKDRFDRLLPSLSCGIERLADAALPNGAGLGIVESIEAPTAYLNLLLVVAAESARRRKSFTEMESAIDQCNNPLLVILWQNWLQRCAKSTYRPAVAL